MKKIKKKFRKIYKKIINKPYQYLTLKVIYPMVYNKHAKKNVVKNKVVFVESVYEEIMNSQIIIYNKLKNDDLFLVKEHFLGYSRVRKKEQFKRAIAFIKDVATAEYVFVSNSEKVIGALTFRNETTITQLWHACGAFKKFGGSTATLGFGQSLEEMYKYPLYNPYDLVCVSSPEIVWAYAEAMQVGADPNNILPIGVSRTDVFFDEKQRKSSYERVLKEVELVKEKKVIVYAPTFRGRVVSSTAPDELDIEMLAKSLADEYILIIKHHPLVKNIPEIPEEYQNFAFDCTSTLSIEDLMFVSDICISDYSSLVFEYSLFEKPMIFFAYDLDEYNDWRGFYYDYSEFTPGPIVKTNEELIDYIVNIDQKFDIQKVKDFKYKFMRSCDGNSTQRILDYTFGDEDTRKKIREELVK